MVETRTPRLGLPRYGAGTDPPVSRADWNETVDDLEGPAVAPYGGVAIDLQGLAAARPAAGVRGRYYTATDTGMTSRDTGTVWLTVGGPVPAAAQAVEDSLSTLNRVGFGSPDGDVGPDGPSLSGLRSSVEGRLMVDWGARMRMTTATGFVVMGWQLTHGGGTAVAAADSRAVWVDGAAQYIYASRRYLVTGLDPAVVYTLTAVYRTNSDALTGEVAYRYLIAHPA